MPIVVWCKVILQFVLLFLPLKVLEEEKVNPVWTHLSTNRVSTAIHVYL